MPHTPMDAVELHFRQLIPDGMLELIIYEVLEPCLKVQDIDQQLLVNTPKLPEFFLQYVFLLV